jgi:antitoxin (DNA-binding transcriptional repressor) of toxin-antitoxin stability system
MHTAGIQTLKNQPSADVRSAAAGATVLVTDRGQVVAERLAPCVWTAASLTKQRPGGLVRQGRMAPATRAPQAPLSARQPMANLADVLGDADLHRADR